MNRNAMLDFGHVQDRTIPAARAGQTIAARPRSRTAYRARLDGLASINRTLAAINRQLRTRRHDTQPAAAMNGLQQVCARVAGEIAEPPDGALARPGTAERYLAGLDRLAQAFAATESMLDDAALERLDWVAQQVRIEYLRAGVAWRGAASN